MLLPEAENKRHSYRQEISQNSRCRRVSGQRNVLWWRLRSERIGSIKHTGRWRPRVRRILPVLVYTAARP